MSKSYRHTPIFGHTAATSESADKAVWHRRFRRQSKLFVAKLVSSLDSDGFDGYLPPAVRSLSNPWSMAKDGHFYMPAQDLTRKALSK
jgi:hypothetical protein